ncbi:MAG: rhomboid family intramembrane serine protease [Verrucomicrobiae bacterium]|nr:rhomboid family intramembrane serine protease [Verrucomicrobiae bacterium]MDW8309597.1 rhomboid family intramembrane serine protease [Verrucomicrobiales bacterium]
MLPLRDNIPSRRFPIVTVTLIALNVVAFVWELSLGRRLQDALLLLGIVPVRYTVSEIADLFSWPEQLWPFLTSMFLHGGWTHLLGNMWTLWIFGDNVEDRLGHLRFLVFYLCGGVAAALLHIFTNATSPVPTIGASGAIAAVMGGYFRLYPHARVEMVIPPFFLGPYFVVPAVVFLGWWFILQFFNGTLSLLSQPDAAGGIAWWAHIGGFVFGAMLCSVIKVKQFYRRHYQDDEMPW